MTRKLNPLVLTVLMRSCRQKHITNNTPSSIFQNHSQFQSYYQKYLRSRQQFL